MAKYQKGRFTENLAYGLPLMPFSDTHDGRIVNFQKKALEQDEKFQQISKYNQKELSQQLKNLYGKNNVTLDDFNSKLNGVTNLLENQTDVLNDQLSENVKTNTNLENIADINYTGFNKVDDTLNQVGTDIVDSISDHKESTSQGLKNISSTISNESDAVRSTLKSGLTDVYMGVHHLGNKLKGPEQSTLSISQYLMTNPNNLGKVITAIKQNKLSSSSVSNVAEYLSKKIGWCKYLENNQKDFSFIDVQSKFSKIKYAKGFKELFDIENQYYSFIKLIENPSLTIIKNINSLNIINQVLSIFSSKKFTEFTKKTISIKELNYFKNCISKFISSFIQYSSGVLTKSDLVFFTNNNYLTAGNAHQVKEHHIEARKEGSLVDINFNIKDLHNQAEISHKHLSNIASGIAQSNNHLVNLEKLSETYINTSIQGFNNINKGLKRQNKTLISGFNGINQNLEKIALISTMIGLKLIDEIQFWGQNILTEVNYTNQLLTKIIELKLNSLKVEGKQRLEQGVFLLKLNDFEDALESFKDGIKQDRTNQYLYFGAGISLEMQNQIKDAIEYYKKSASRAKGANEMVFASASMQKVARLYYYLKDYENAISCLSLAIDLNNHNITAKFELAKVLTEEANYNQSRNIILDLINYDNKFLKVIKQDNSFQTMPFENILEELVDKNIVKKEKIMIELLNDFLTLKNKEYALMINNSLINNSITYVYLKLRIWENPAFENIRNDFTNLLKEKNNKKSLISFRNQRYSASFLLFYLDFPVEEIANCFIEELNNDKYRLYEDSNKVIEQLNRVDKENSKILLSKISKYLSKYEWLKI